MVRNTHTGPGASAKCFTLLFPINTMEFLFIESFDERVNRQWVQMDLSELWTNLTGQTPGIVS